MTRQGQGQRPGLSTVHRWILLGGCLLAPATAQAAGIEDTVAGGVALGRAANHARVNDFMATWQNPANLALAPRNVGAEIRLPFFNACFDRQRDNRTTNPDGTPLDQDGNGTPGIQYRPEENFDEVCNEAPLFPAGNLGFSMPIGEKLGIGTGFFTPAGIGNLKFGSDNSITVDPKLNEIYPTNSSGVLSPNRALLLDRQVLAGFLALGVGYAPFRDLRVGASVAAGFADVHYRNIASLGPGFTDQEVLNDVKVRDSFIPRVTLSAALTPINAVDLFSTFTWNDDITAKGHVDLTANGVSGAPRRSCEHVVTDPMTGTPKQDPGTHCRVNDVTLKVPYQRFEAIIGGRYASRRVPRARVLDPMTQEKWDVELEGFWVNTGHVTNYELNVYTLKPGATVVPAIAFSSDPKFSGPSGIPPKASLPHQWKDTYGARLGGDYNVLPGVLAVRAGVAYETRGVPIKNMNIDYWPVQKVALHAGATWRVKLVDLTIAYAHMFNETINVPVGSGNVREVTAVAPEKALAVNEGRYRSQIDVVSLQGNYRF